MHIEDVFVRFFRQIVSIHFSMFPHKDYEVCYSFYHSIRDGKHLTESQRTYVKAMLSRYRGLSQKFGFDYRAYLENPTWKHPVRVISKDRTVWVEDHNEVLSICLQFPYSLKDPFTEQIERIYQGKTYFDYEHKIRKLNAYKINLFAFHDWIEKNGFEQQESYAELFANYEAYVDDCENIVPYATVLDGNIFLVNCAESADTYFDEHKTGNYHEDLFLLKRMGIPLTIQNPVTTIEKIASESTNGFWMPDMNTFIEAAYCTSGRAGIILDRSANVLEWLAAFFKAFDEQGRNPADVKVCIKEGRHQNKDLNKWLYDNRTAGTNKAKFLIFLHKPSKWIFKDEVVFDIVGTNAIYPSTNTLTNNWLQQHSCVAYLTDIKPSLAKGQHIAKL